MVLLKMHFRDICIGGFEIYQQDLLEQKQRKAPRCTIPDVSCTTRQLSFILLQKKSSFWACRPALVSTKPRQRARTQSIYAQNP